jgi:hypothetical protein
VIPTTWTMLLDRLAYQLGGRSDGFRAEAEEWVRDAVEARYGVRSLHELDRPRRQIAFQKCSGVLLALEQGDGSYDDLAFQSDCRRRVAAAFARYFDGVAINGPPWRISPVEEYRPTWDEWQEPPDFALLASGRVE